MSYLPMLMNVAIVAESREAIQESLDFLSKRNWPIQNLRVLVPEELSGESVTFSGKDYMAEKISDASLSRIDVAFMSAGETMSRVYRPKIVKSGAGVIDLETIKVDRAAAA